MYRKVHWVFMVFGEGAIGDSEGNRFQGLRLSLNRALEVHKRIEKVGD